MVTTNTFITVNPIFTIKNRSKLITLIEQCVDVTKTHKGIIYYGATIDDEVVEFHEAYMDLDSVLAHNTAMDDMLKALLQPDVSVIKEITVAGPYDDAHKVAESLSAFGCVPYVVIPEPGFVNNTKELSGTTINPDHNIMVHPTFTVQDWNKAIPILTQCVDGTKKHEGNIYYDFVKSSDNKLKCRECWTTAEALDNHINGPNGIGEIMGSLVAPGIATLDSIYVSGPSPAVAKAQKIFDAFGCTIKETHQGLSRITL